MGCRELDIRSQFYFVGAGKHPRSRETTADRIENRTHNNVNELTDRDTTPLTYDEAGNLTSANLATGDWTYLFDAENRLSEAKRGWLTLNFAYDVFGRRTLKATYADSHCGRWLIAESHFQYDGYNLIETRDVRGCGRHHRERLTKTFVWSEDLTNTEQGAGGVGGLVAEISGSRANKVYFATYNSDNGNITAYVKPNGRIAARYVYSPFGRVIHQSGYKSWNMTHRFSTKPYDQTTGLVYYNFRYFSPELGRWTSRDPIGEEAFYKNNAKLIQNKKNLKLYKQSLKPAYLFTSNNSINIVDLYGLVGSGASPGTAIGSGRICLTAAQIARARILAKNMCAMTIAGHCAGDTWSPGVITYHLPVALIFYIRVNYIVICHMNDKCKTTATAMSVTGDDTVCPVD